MLLLDVDIVDQAESLRVGVQSVGELGLWVCLRTIRSQHCLFKILDRAMRHLCGARSDSEGGVASEIRSNGKIG